MKKLFFAALILILTVFSTLQVFGQCAMCRSTVVNNVSNGEQLGLAAGLNTGILYLFVTPYLLVGIIAILWYRTARANRKRVKS